MRSLPVVVGPMPRAGVSGLDVWVSDGVVACSGSDVMVADCWDVNVIFVWSVVVDTGVTTGDFRKRFAAPQIKKLLSAILQRQT
jgi:hypothetical protein